MPSFSRKIPYDRKRLLEGAMAATKQGRWRRATSCYRHILAAEPLNYEIHRRVAPLLARCGRSFEAWESFRLAAESPESVEDPKRAEAIYHSATRALPGCVDAWRALARTRLRCRRPEAALEALLEGRRHFRTRRAACKATQLLRDARQIAPWDRKIVLDLCQQLRRQRQPAEALFLLDELDRRCPAQERRSVRALIFRIDPTLGNTWRWLRAG